MRFILNCEEVRFQSGADPRHLSLGQRFHLLMCSACRGYVGSLQRLDQRIESTLRAVSGGQDTNRVDPSGLQSGDVASGPPERVERSQD